MTLDFKNSYIANIPLKLPNKKGYLYRLNKPQFRAELRATVTISQEDTPRILV